MWLTLLCTVLVIAAVYLYKILKDRAEFWTDQPIKHIPAWPLLGNYHNIVLRRRTTVDAVKDMYNYYPNERYVGITIFITPSLMIRDLDLLKTITIKDFDHFTDHNGGELDSIDPMMTKNLFLLTGQRWKDMRDTLSPAFSSAKMKAMYGLMSQCGKQFVDHLKSQAVGELIEIEMKEMVCRYTTDVIATCAYGTEVNSFKDKNNEFFKLGKEAMHFSGFKGIKFLLLMSSPNLLKFFRLPVFGKRETDFFQSLTEQTMSYRKSSKLIRPDMIHLLMEAQKGEIKISKEEAAEETGYASQQNSTFPNEKTGNTSCRMTNEDIAAQAFIFFLGGFDTASTVMSFMSYELAMNVEIQRKLQNEVDTVMEMSKDGLPTYDLLVKMKYLDMVVCESLRKWTPATQTDRVCVKDYTIEPVLPHEKPLLIKKGTLIMIPTIGIHYDHKYFNDPYKFDPERFNDENKKDIVPYSYLPFGIGPRFCIGNRFAILEMKVLMIQILSQFDISLTKNSTVPIILETNNMNNRIVGGFNLGFKLRKNK